MSNKPKMQPWDYLSKEKMFRDNLRLQAQLNDVSGRMGALLYELDVIERIQQSKWFKSSKVLKVVNELRKIIFTQTEVRDGKEVASKGQPANEEKGNEGIVPEGGEESRDVDEGLRQPHPEVEDGQSRDEEESELRPKRDEGLRVIEGEKK